jgi:hypothetical protein
MDVPELLNPLLFGMDVEIVIAHQPEWPFRALLRDGGLQSLNCAIQDPAPRLGNQQMNMLWHKDISKDKRDISLANGFKCMFENIAGRSGGQIGEASVAAEGEEMKIRSLLEAFKLGWHDKGIVLSP